MATDEVTKDKVADQPEKPAPDKLVNAGKKPKSSIQLTEQELNKLSGGSADKIKPW